MTIESQKPPQKKDEQVGNKMVAYDIRRARRMLNSWWIFHGCPPDFCLICNDGNHVYVSNDTKPGENVKTPLHLFKWRERVTDVGDIWIKHLGHMTRFLHLGKYLRSHARVYVFNGYDMRPILLPPFHVIYVIQTADKCLKYITVRMKLSPELLPFVQSVPPVPAV